VNNEARPHTVDARKARRFQDAARAVESAVSRFRRQCPHQDPRELRSVAWIAAIEAFRTWKPERADFYAYAGRATFMALAKFTLRMGQPLSAPDAGGKPDPNGDWVTCTATGKQVRRKIGGRWGLDTTNTEFLDAFNNANSLAAPDYVARAAAKDAEERWRLRLEARLQAVVGTDDAAFELLLAGKAPPATRARATLAAAMTTLRERLRNDNELRSIWGAREE
jgi:hypothetical protein